MKFYCEYIILFQIDQKSKYCSQSPPRPESLMFESIMTNLDMELADSENNNGPCSMNIRTRNKKKKRRAADNSVKKFEGNFFICFLAVEVRRFMVFLGKHNLKSLIIFVG